MQDSEKKRKIQNLMGHAQKGLRVKQSILAILEDEINELVKDNLPLKYIYKELQSRYGFDISYRHFVDS